MVSKGKALKAVWLLTVIDLIKQMGIVITIILITGPKDLLIFQRLLSFVVLRIVITGRMPGACAPSIIINGRKI
ncbi:hypothetical protein AF332_16850 [Sporosarcina globispora]|uniref:Uncharacterized protein n=1 Tax=Sporosarcina globispora TaxID=1459 RepID=A0A0M0GEU1_SPOGL|nr:hypothetical protein AF332_16850 [Sporosarcina globispora]